MRAATLGEICAFNYGKSLPASQRQVGRVSVFGSNGPVGTHKEPLLQGPAIVIGRKGSYGEVHFSDGPLWPIDTTYYVDGNSTDCDLRWLHYLLKFLPLNTLNKSAAIPGLNREDAYRLPVLVPSLFEQRRMAAILDKADALRRKRKRAIELHEGLIQSTFLEMFSDPAINAHGYPHRAFGEISDKMSDGPFGSNLKSEHYVEAGIRVIRLQNIGTGEFIDADKAFVSEDHFRSLAKHECRPGDVLVGTLGDPNLRACLQPEWMPIALNKADCVQIRPNPDVAVPEYIVALINQPSVEKLAQGLMLGQTRTRISMGRLRQLRVPIAPLKEQLQFVAKIRAISQIKKSAEISMQDVDSLFSSLQSRAFSGQL